MSTSYAQMTVTRLKNGVTYSAMITCTTGDLFQQYNASAVSPDWEKTTSLRPVLRFHCVSSANTSGETIPSNISILYDGVKVIFATGSKVSQDGMFEVSGGGTTPWQVKVLKNFASASSSVLAGHMITIVGEIGVGQYVQAQIPVTLSPLTGTGEEVHIIGEGATPFVVDQNTGSTTKLIAQVYQGGTVLSTPDSSFKFQWQKFSGSGWTDISGATSSAYTVKASDVESYAIYRVVVTHGSLTYSDTQSVMDIGDPYYLALDVVNSAGGNSPNFEVNAAAGTTLKFTPSLVARNGGTAPAATFTWQIVKPDGVIVNNTAISAYSIPAKGTAAATLTVPLSFVDDYGLDVFNVVVTATF